MYPATSTQAILFLLLNVTGTSRASVPLPRLATEWFDLARSTEADGRPAYPECKPNYGQLGALLDGAVLAGLVTHEDNGRFKLTVTGRKLAQSNAVCAALKAHAIHVSSASAGREGSTNFVVTFTRQDVLKGRARLLSSALEEVPGVTIHEASFEPLAGRLRFSW